MAKKEPTVIGVLKRTRALIRKGWAQGYYAKTRQGDHVRFNESGAVSFCLMGAQMKAADDLEAERLIHLTVKLIKGCLPSEYKRSRDGRDPVVSFNDAKGRTKNDILKVVDCAIAKAIQA